MGHDAQITGSYGTTKRPLSARRNRRVGGGINVRSHRQRYRTQAGTRKSAQIECGRNGGIYPLEDIETGKTNSHCRYFNLKVLESQVAEQVNECVSNNFDQRAIELSNKSTSYVDIADLVEAHVTCNSDKDTVNTTLKRVHIAISNAKRTLLGIYHCINGKSLQ